MEKSQVTLKRLIFISYVSISQARLFGWVFFFQNFDWLISDRVPSCYVLMTLLWGKIKNKKKIYVYTPNNLDIMKRSNRNCLD